MSYSSECQGQTTISPSDAQLRFQPVSAVATTVPLVAPWQSGPFWWKQTFGKRVVLAPHVEKPDLATLHFDDNVPALGQVVHIRHDEFLGHRAGSASLSSRMAFWPMILRRTSSDTGICSTLLG